MTLSCHSPHHHFTENRQEAGELRLEDLPKITQQVKGRARM